MPPKNDPAHRHPKAAPRARRKSKPKFEVPVETGLHVAPVEWVYRTDAIPFKPAIAERRSTEKASQTTPFQAAGMGLFFVGAATMGFVSLVALGLVAMPMGITRRLFAAI